MQFDRRSLIGMLAVSSLPLPLTARAQSMLRVRHDVDTPTGLDMLAKYAEAVRRMRARPASDPLSWTFQWYLHAVPGNLGKAGALEAIFGSAPSAARDLAAATWSSCEPHFSGKSDLFLPWHRIYVLSLEAIIRKVLEDDSFVLPYWDYTKAGGRAIPAAFRAGSAASWGPLRQANRRKTALVDINAGDSMDSGATVSPFDLRSMARPGYGGAAGFCATIDQTLHGAVHVGVGDSTNMGAVPTAAGDALFWLHHCNIDRIWAGWNRAGGKNPQFSGSFVFADPSGDALYVDIADATTTEALGYQYDSLPSLPRSSQISAATSAAELETVASSAGEIALTPGATRVPIRASGEIGSSVLGGEEAGRVLVMFDGLRTAIDPGTLYEAFIDLPDNADSDQRRRHYLGTFGFFGKMGEHAHGGGPSFDVTETVKLLNEARALGPETVITIEPVGMPAAGSQPIVGRIEILRQ